MNIKDLRYICALSEYQHFGKAAKRCHVTQPTLSGQIKKLEQELGVKLFERTPSQVILTDIGEMILKSARHIIKEVDTIYDIAQTTHQPLGGTCRLGAIPTLSNYIFPDLVKKVKKALPDLRLILIEAKTEALLDQLKKGELDAGLLALPINDNRLISQQLFDDTFYLAVPKGHQLTRHKKIHNELLAGHSIFLLEEGHCLRDQALAICQLYNIDEEQDFKGTNLETLRQMVKAGTGITLIPNIAISNNETDLCYLPFDPPMTRTIGLVFRKTSRRKILMEKLMCLF